MANRVPVLGVSDTSTLLASSLLNWNSSRVLTVDFTHLPSSFCVEGANNNMAQAIQEYVESRRTARMTHEPLVNPDEIVLRSFLGPAALDKRIGDQRIAMKAQRDAHESDQRTHMAEQAKLQQEFEARFKPRDNNSPPASPMKSATTLLASGPGAAVGPASVSQQQQQLTEGYRSQIKEEEAARLAGARVGPFLRLRPSAEVDRRAAMRSTASPNAAVAAMANTITRTMGSGGNKKGTRSGGPLPVTSRGVSGRTASPLVVEGMGQEAGSTASPNFNGPRYIIQTGITIPEAYPRPNHRKATPGTPTNTAPPPAPPPAAQSDTTGVEGDPSTGAAAAQSPLTNRPKPLVAARVSSPSPQPQSSSPTAGASSRGISVNNATTKAVAIPRFANPASLVEDEVANRAIHQGPVSLASLSPRVQTATSGGIRGGGLGLYDDSTRRRPMSAVDSPLPQLGSEPTPAFRHVPLPLQPLMASVGNNPKQYAPPAPMSKWYPSLQTQLAEKAARELAANPPPLPPVELSVGETPPPPAPTTPAASPPKKKKPQADTSVISLASLAPIIGAPLELNVKSSLFDASLAAAATQRKEKVWEVASQFQQPAPPPVIKKKKPSSASNSMAKRFSVASNSNNRGASPPKKKKGNPGPPSDPTTTIHPNLKGIFAELRSVADPVGRISSAKFTLLMNELGVFDLTHINRIFIHLESTNKNPGFVMLGSALAAFHQLLNGSNTSNLMADVCFDLFDLDDRGYIHKAHLDCLRFLRTGLDGGEPPHPNGGQKVADDLSVAPPSALRPAMSAAVEEGLRASTRACARRILKEEEESRNKLDLLIGRAPRVVISGLIPDGDEGGGGVVGEETHLVFPGGTTSFDDGGSIIYKPNPGLSILGNNTNIMNANSQPSRPHVMCTAEMTKALQDLFQEVRRQEEEAYINLVIRKGKKGKASKKKLPVLPDTQNSYIPVTNMRVAHISRETFRKHFACTPSLVTAFARRWLLTLAVGDQEPLVLETEAAIQAINDEELGGNGGHPDESKGPFSEDAPRLISVADVACGAVSRYEQQ